jgi:hypothetical protein
LQRWSTRRPSSRKVSEWDRQPLSVYLASSLRKGPAYVAPPCSRKRATLLICCAGMNTNLHFADFRGGKPVPYLLSRFKLHPFECICARTISGQLVRPSGRIGAFLIGTTQVHRTETGLDDHAVVDRATHLFFRFAGSRGIARLWRAEDIHLLE